MIEKATQLLKEKPNLKLRFVPGSIGHVREVGKRFDWVVSVGCLCCTGESESSFRQNIAHVCAAVGDRGQIVLMEPIHRWWPLRRVCPFPFRDWIAEFRHHGFSVRHADGIIFAPFKFLCALLPLPKGVTDFFFRLGERLLRLPFLKMCLSDYKVLVFERVAPEKRSGL
jgi:hypothetical protein